MYKIKLSILLLTSFFIFSCTNNQNHSFSQKYSLAYIGGEFDGLLLKNYLLFSLRNLDIYDPNSIYEISASISHSSNLYITNIENTSEREKINTNLSFQVTNILSECEVIADNVHVSQFFIYAPSTKFLSNQTALQKIKKDNTESAVKQLINNLRTVKNKCDE